MSLAIFVAVVTIAVVWWVVRYLRVFYQQQSLAFEAGGAPLAAVLENGVANAKTKSIGGYHRGHTVTAAVRFVSKDANDNAIYAFVVTMNADLGPEKWKRDAGAMAIRYDRKHATITSQTIVADMTAWPSPETFSEQLDALDGIIAEHAPARVGA